MSSALPTDTEGLPTGEFLSAGELHTLTGKSTGPAQCKVLHEMGWHFTRCGSRPIVGRWYARLKAAGLNPSMAANDEPDLGAIS